MVAKRLTPILNVSNIQQSFAWFEKLGWKKAWEWGTPPGFGGVCSGDCEIFLCENAQGSRGRSAVRNTFGPEGDDAADKGVWMAIWVDDVDAVHQQWTLRDARHYGSRLSRSGTNGAVTTSARRPSDTRSRAFRRSSSPS